MTARPAVAGLAEHRGWAIAVCVAARAGVPFVVDRRRLELVGDGVPSQPHHHEAQTLPLGKAEALVARVEESVATCAREGLEALRNDIAPEHRLVGIALLQPHGRLIPETVGEILRSQKAAMDADGALYHRAVRDAATALGLDVALHPRGADDAAVAELLQDLGRALGPPWQKDHRAAAAAAIGALTGAAKQNKRAR